MSGVEAGPGGRSATEPDADPHAAAARRRLLADLAEASRVFTGTWPLQDFISANPLEGLIDETFADAARIAGENLGARVVPSEAWMRGLHHDGRITDDDLHRALEVRVPQALRQPPVVLAGNAFTPQGILIADLLHGDLVPDPQRTHLVLARRRDGRLADRIETHTITYLAAYFDEGRATWSMPGREDGLYAAWSRLAAFTPGLPRRTRRMLRDLPARPADALLQALTALGVPAHDRVPCLRSHLAALPGWTARVRGRQDDLQDGIANLLDYLAMRVSLEAAFLVPLHPGTTAYDAVPPHRPDGPALPSPRDRAVHVLTLLVGEVDDAERNAVADLLALMPPRQRELVWLEAYEGHYRIRLLDALDREGEGRELSGTPIAQVACCIDNRAEGLRRHLEETGPYQTMGFAGFFSVAMRFASLGSSAYRHQHPGPGTAGFDLTETPAAGRERSNARHLAGRRMAAAARGAWHRSERIPAAPFVLAEATGWVAGALGAARTLAPRMTGGLFAKTAGALAPPATTTLTVDALPREVRADTAASILTLLGLTTGFARLVVFVGHTATSANNPYQAVLECGACGGHSGAPNARAAAELLNDEQVRADLAARGIRIPPTTHFLPAQHNTTTDAVTILDAHLVPAGHADDVARLREDLRTAGERVALDRVAVLPGATGRTGAGRARRHVTARSLDWAQAFPEWGLAGNAATIIAPRSLTRGVDLGGRVFLHDYDAAGDPDGSVLQTLLMGPTIVAQWISCQYYFSAVDPGVLGAGSKTLHNVVGGGQGVMAGPTTDLQLGLPWQSLSDGRQLRHEPMRMLTLVQAPTASLDAIIAANPMLRDLVVNEWITLCAREDAASPWQRFSPAGWRVLSRRAVPR